MSSTAVRREPAADVGASRAAATTLARRRSFIRTRHAPPSPSCSRCFTRSEPPTMPMLTVDRNFDRKAIMSGVAVCAVGGEASRALVVLETSWAASRGGSDVSPRHRRCGPYGPPSACRPRQTGRSACPSLVCQRDGNENKGSTIVQTNGRRTAEIGLDADGCSNQAEFEVTIRSFRGPNKLSPLIPAKIRQFWGCTSFIARTFSTLQDQKWCADYSAAAARVHMCVSSLR
jgi:hypothetical protein